MVIKCCAAVAHSSAKAPLPHCFLRVSERALIELEIVAAGDPKSVVERAVALKRDAEKEAKRKNDPFLRYEEVWCVFDIDDHLRVTEAKQQARDTGLCRSHMPGFEKELNQAKRPWNRSRLTPLRRAP